MSPPPEVVGFTPPGGSGAQRLPWLRGLVVLTLAPEELSVTEHTGSFPVEFVESALLSVVALELPSVNEPKLTIQAQETVDNITFADVGDPLELKEAGTKAVSVNPITGTWLRLKVTWSKSSPDEDSVVAELELRPQGEAKALSPDPFRQFMPLPVFLRDSTFKVVNPFVGAWMTGSPCVPASETGNGSGETKPLG